MHKPMKIRFLKNWCGEEDKTRLQETWDVSYSKWTELNVERVEAYPEKTADLLKYDGNVVRNVPLEAFEAI